MTDNMIKVLLIGDTTVGKSSILVRYVDNQFFPSFMSTIGLDFRTTKIPIDENRTCSMQLWDTAGQERFLSITRAYIRGASGIILVYDITRAESFSNCKMWLQTIQDYADEKVTVFLVGNKTDLAQDRQVSHASAKSLADELDIDLFEVSAKDGTNVRDLFYKVAVKLSSKLPANEEATHTVMVNSNQSSSKCCG
ncbi:hypothetical protein P9112_005427 [Eukaryota sp. TZLM1-RC]